MPLPKDILAYHKGLAPADRRICEALAAIIEASFSGKAAPAGVERKVWHRHPVWFIDGNPIVGYSKLKGDGGKGGKGGGSIRLLFWSGQSFDEPGLAPAPPDTKFKSADARYTAIEQIDAKLLARWLRKSVETQWDYKNIVKRKGRLERLR